jgi:hypothetical protein
MESAITSDCARKLVGLPVLSELHYDYMKGRMSLE